MKTTKLYPLQFEPQYQYRLWGGNNFSTLFKRAIPGKQLGESWEICGLKEKPSIVSNGVFKGESILSLMEQFPKALLGESVLNRFGKQFPLLIKFIDAKIPLSVQVHPNDELAKERHNSFGKNEMWYILDAEPDAELIMGFNQEIDKQQYQKLLKENRVEEVLHREKVSAGDVVYIPTGRIHAIGGGVLLAEIQQSSDITYRVYDYNRVDAQTGKTRELHNDLALDALDFSVQKTHKIDYSKKVNQVNTIVETPYFNTSFLSVNGTLKREYPNCDSFRILMCVSGSLSINYAEEEYPLANGSCLLIPAAIEQLSIQGKGDCLEVFVPDQVRNDKDQVRNDKDQVQSFQ